jgi:hypothetical protein
MTVKELIEYLQALPDQSKVVVLAYDDGLRGDLSPESIAMVGPYVCFCAAMSEWSINNLIEGHANDGKDE